ncbi:MAG TPA: hypothetical protein VJM08_08810 [Anaerolineales bacterium]|nr:hypothetical protein [Anaerolineales bacterium]
MSTSTLSTQILDSRTLWRGALAGIIGGIPFGIMMGMMGMMPMIGMLVRVENAFVGAFVHAAISAITGAIYAFFAVRFPLTWGNAILGGIVYGVIWWVLGALILMPALLGMFENIFVIGQMQWMSLLGHIIFGVVLALSFTWLSRRAM